MTVAYATANGTATAGSDYVAASGTLTFLAGQTSKTVAVTVNGDAAVEADETFTVNLSGAAGATIADAQGGGTITNDDLPGADFYTVPPCRVLDSRLVAGPWAGAPLAGGQQRDLAIGAACGIPMTAQAVSINVTAVDATADGHLRLFPAGGPLPTSSVVNFRIGLTRANNAIVQLGSAAAITVYSGQAAPGAVHVVVDVNGWFE